MIRKVKLASIPAGKNFAVWGREYTVLDQQDGKTFVLQNSIEADMQFKAEKEDSKPMNEYRYSDIRSYLETEYLDDLKTKGADLDKDLLEFPVDLACTLGQHEYGVVYVKAGLLTLKQYGDYYDLIPKLDDWWWLATPYLTPSRSPCCYSYGGSTLALCVLANGDWYNYYCSNSYGVRPALTLSSCLLVSCDDGQNEDEAQSADTLSSLSTYTTSELLDELNRRYQEAREYD